MNLFITDKNPCTAAGHLDDLRVGKIALEATQILCTVLHERGIVAPYKPTHPFHPVTKWAGEDERNANWTLNYGFELCRIFLNWRGRDHACRAVLQSIEQHISFCGDPVNFQNSARGHGLDFTHLPVVEGYRTYITTRWLTGKTVPRWTGRHAPHWFNDQQRVIAA